MLCTAQMPLGLPNERVFDVLPLQPEDAVRLLLAYRQLLA